MLNRSVVIVRPKQPYLAWAERLDGAGVVPGEVDDLDQTIYLVPSFETHDDAWEIVEEIYDALFENELCAWQADPAVWPENRTFELFLEWFDIEFHAVVEDVCDYEILDDEEEEDQGAD